jgi:Tol biopolymer transport system component
MKNIKARALILVGIVLTIALAIFIGFSRRMTTGKTIAQKGDQIALMISPKGKMGSNLFVLDIESGEAVQLTQGEKTRNASWSPDGERMAIVYGKSWDLYTLDVSTGDTQKLVENDKDLYQVVWSPDGQRLAYEANEITIVDRDGNPALGYKLVQGYGGRGFDWSPDGKKIIYVDLDDPEDPRSHTSLHVIEADSSSSPELLLSFDGLEKAPKWSPDGSHILFKVETAHDQWGGALEEALYVANADGNDVTEIAAIAARGIPVFWSPDGSQILFEDVDAQICRYHVETGEVECNFPGLYPVWDSRGEQIAYLNSNGQLCVSAGLTTGRCYRVLEEGTIYILGWRP